MHPAIPDAVRHVLDSGGMCGYGHSCGLPAAREAIARLYSPYTNDPKGVSPQVSRRFTVAIPGAYPLVLRGGGAAAAAAFLRKAALRVDVG